MPLSFSADIKPTMALLKTFGPEALARRGRAGMQEALPLIVEEVQANTPVYQDKLRAGIHAEINGTAFDGLHGQVVPAAATMTYAMVQEEGRRAGSRPPPSDAIAGWVAAKLGSGVSAYVVARSIGRKGFAGKHMFAKARAKAPAILERIFVKHFRAVG